MDPDANLKEQLKLTADIMAALEGKADDGVDAFDVDVARLCELVEALDGWIRKGGFLPAEWRAR